MKQWKEWTYIVLSNISKRITFRHHQDGTSCVAQHKGDEKKKSDLIFIAFALHQIARFFH